MTQRRLAEVTGMNATHLSAIENGQVCPRVDLLIRIADALGVEAADLLKPVPARASEPQPAA